MQRKAPGHPSVSLRDGHAPKDTASEISPPPCRLGGVTVFVDRIRVSETAEKYGRGNSLALKVPDHENNETDGEAAQGRRDRVPDVRGAPWGQNVEHVLLEQADNDRSEECVMTDERVKRGGDDDTREEMLQLILGQ